MFAGVIFVVSSSSELQSPPLSTRNILAPGTIELSTNVRKDFTNMKEAPTRAY